MKQKLIGINDLSDTSDRNKNPEKDQENFLVLFHFQKEQYRCEKIFEKF